MRDNQTGSSFFANPRASGMADSALDHLWKTIVVRKGSRSNRLPPRAFAADNTGCQQPALCALAMVPRSPVY
jgi:hypothetical protein